MSNAGHLKYRNINELLLKAKVDYNGKKPDHVFERLPRMRGEAEKARKKGDEETQYILLRRWLDTVEWLKRTHEYRNHKSIWSVNLYINEINEVKNILKDLNQRLDAEYKKNTKEKVLPKISNSEQMDIDVETQISRHPFTPAVDGPIRLPETPTKDPMTDNEEFMSCEQLFQIIQKLDSRCLVIDTRPKPQFDNSRISSDNCINIPQSEIKHGVSTAHFERYLLKENKKAFALFKNRGPQYNDVLVLLDWNGTSGSVTPQSHISILKQILKDWDPGIRYKKIVFLEGGYAEWLTRYPTFTTNPNATEPNSTNPSNEILDDIEYPEWLHSDEEDNVIKMRDSTLSRLKSTNKDNGLQKSNISKEKIRIKQVQPEVHSSITLPIKRNFPSATVSQPMEVDTADTGTNLRLYQNDSSKLQHKRSLSLAKQTDTVSRPTVDRSSKPATLKPTNLEAKAVLKLTRQLTDIAKNKEKLEEEILEQERSLYVEDSNEGEYIRGNLDSLYGKLEDAQNSYTKVEDQLSKYNKETPAIKFSSKEKYEKDSLALDLELYRRRIKRISQERTELRDKAMQVEQKPESKETKEIAGVHKEPLKGEHTSVNPTLERSYSSPNLLQLGGHKAPRVDRSSKPQVPTHNRNESNGNDSIKISHISWANREERMAPIHGSVHPGITGLKNLGNSCYMNSIIQCLSNTTQLAKYFTDNLYVDDVNTNNDSSTQGQIVEEVAQVIKALWRGQYKSISPHDLKLVVGQYKLQFNSYEQQDSHEFLTFLLDWMHNDLRREDKIYSEMTVAEKAWDKSMDSQTSIISKLFFGQLRSTITCSVCKQGSTTYETFNSLTTSLPSSSRCTLNDCIQRFVTGQKVVGWKCPKCQTPREATKKFDFVKLAPVIVIHLNRFAESGGWLEKRNTAVEFPLTGFNLKPYLIENNSVVSPNMRSYNYSLYAMSNHYGTMDGGHYTAYCKNAAQNKWYKYDDQTVTEVTPSQVKSQTNTAYLLFYSSSSSNII